MAYKYPPTSIYSIKPDGKYYYDSFENPPSGLRHHDHFTQDEQFSWPSWWLNATPETVGADGTGRGYRWHQAERYNFVRRGVGSLAGSPISNNPFTKTPFHIESKKYGSTWIQEYKYAKSPDPKYQIPDNKNPLSDQEEYTGYATLIFSEFRHYLGNNPEGFKDPPYTVSRNKPIERKSHGGKYNGLNRIMIWSPYNDDVYIDFKNGKAYDESLEKSSVWG